MVKITLINGSPRKYGASRKLLTIAGEGIRDAGGEPVIIDLYDYKIKECLGCVSDNQKVCRFPCIIRDDDFNKLGEKLLESEGFIIATPIYWYGVSGKLKNFIDRLTSMENMIIHTGRSLLEGKVAGFIATGNDSGSIMAISYLMVVFNSMGVHIPPWALAYHHTSENVLSDDQAVMDSYNVGYIVAKAASIGGVGQKWYMILEEEKMDDLRRKAVREASKHRDQVDERNRLFEHSNV